MTHNRCVHFVALLNELTSHSLALYQPGTLDLTNLSPHHVYYGTLTELWVKLRVESGIKLSVLVDGIEFYSTTIRPAGQQSDQTFSLLELLGRTSGTQSALALGSTGVLSLALSRMPNGSEEVAVMGVAEEVGEVLAAGSDTEENGNQEGAMKRWVLVYGANEADRFEFAPEAYPGWLFAELLVRADTEATYDKLKFLGNGILVDEWSGATPLKMLRFPIQAGNHQLTLTYTKDVQDSSGEDRVWVHSLRVISPESSWAADFSGGMPSSFQLSGDANWEVVNGVLQTPAMLNDQSATIAWNVSLLVQEGG